MDFSFVSLTSCTLCSYKRVAAVSSCRELRGWHAGCEELSPWPLNCSQYHKNNFINYSQTNEAKFLPVVSVDHSIFKTESGNGTKVHAKTELSSILQDLNHPPVNIILLPDLNSVCGLWPFWIQQQ